MATIPVTAESDGMGESLESVDDALFFDFHRRRTAAPSDDRLKRRRIESPHATRVGLGMVALGDEEDDEDEMDYDDDLDDDEDLDDDDLDDDLDDDDDHDPNPGGDEH